MKNGFDFKDVEKFRDRLDTASQSDIDFFFENCAKELAARLLAKVIKRTPVGQYPKSSGKVGGTLRRGWTNGENSNASKYAESLKIEKKTGYYEITISNPVEYAGYVENGHRTRNHKGWVKGLFMLKISEEELRVQSPLILQKKMEQYLRSVFM